MSSSDNQENRFIKIEVAPDDIIIESNLNNVESEDFLYFITNGTFSQIYLKYLKDFKPEQYKVVTENITEKANKILETYKKETNSNQPVIPVLINEQNNNLGRS